MRKGIPDEAILKFDTEVANVLILDFLFKELAKSIELLQSSTLVRVGHSFSRFRFKREELCSLLDGQSILSTSTDTLSY